MKIRSQNDVLIKKNLILLWVNNPEKAGKKLKLTKINLNETCTRIKEKYEFVKMKTQSLQTCDITSRTNMKNDTVVDR